MDTTQNKQKLTIARDKLLQIADNPYNDKFKNLAQHEMLRAKIFKSENKPSNKKFLRYKRGTIVFIHFGINVGSEFSKSHFGIVLDKQDHPNQGQLTILPLTSKKSKDSISIGKAVFSGIMDDEVKQINTIQEVLKVTEEIENLYRALVKPPEFIQISEYHKNYNIWMNFFRRHDPNELYVPAANVTVREWIQSDIDKVNHLRKMYQNYNKISYAKINSITTISKFKIAKPINDLDPIGKIRLSEDIMQKIDKALAKKLLAGEWKRLD